ncbi:MAG: DNA polymerase III subunit alpha [Caldilineales bacterium]|nr:DNA polymerase III subunit alpha [Caldilineales bacterium]
MAMANTEFTHLQVYSHYSLLRATANVEQLASRASQEGFSHLALTDRNALYGVVAFARACQNAGITPLIGMTVLLQTEADMTDAKSALEVMTLIAANSDGYRSLCRLSSHIQAHPYREQKKNAGLTWQELADHAGGLIAVAGGRRSRLGESLRGGDIAAAARYVSRLGGVFDERAFLASEIHHAEDHVIAAEIAGLSARFGIPVVAMQPVYCMEPEDRHLLRLLRAIDLNMRIEQVPPEELPDSGDENAENYWISLSEIEKRFADHPDFVANVAEVVQICSPALPDGRAIWPALDLPAGQTPDGVLANLAEQGMQERYEGDDLAETAVRLQKELGVIAEQGFSPLFLLVADIVGFARSQDIPVSTRGSVANSLVAYCVGITTVDPILHDLLFERFLNPARSEAPDIDLDFCSRRRDEVLDYVRQRYGEDRFALVSTLSTMRPRSALREAGKAYGLDNDVIDDLVKRAPHGWHPDPRRRTTATLADLAETLPDATQRRVVIDAARIIGQPHHLSVHPGGIVICPGPLTDFVPVQMAPKGFLITQFDHVDAEAIGLPKVDLLGIRALTVLSDAAELIRRNHDPNFRVADIRLDDPATAKLISQARTIGVFQCESTGAQRTLRQLQARNVADLAIANAFFKPGPATGGMAKAFVRRYRGEERVEYLHAALEPILGRTKGVLIFQEQILRIATEIAGLSWAQADHLRRGMSKFQATEMEAMREAFVDGCQRPTPGPGFSLRQASALWEQVVAFAGYGFNQGHATAYADVSYRSAFLKTHFPTEFLCARLADHGGFHHPAIYMAEAVRLGIRVKPPYVNRSRSRFTLTFEPDPTLWMGLGQVRDLRRTTIRSMIAARRERTFDDVRDVLARVPMQAKEIRHLIQCGALDGLGEHRAGMLNEAEGILSSGSALQLAFDFDRAETEADAPQQRLAWERATLGLPVSVTPLDALNDRDGAIPLKDLQTRAGRRYTTLGFRLPGWTGGKGFFLSDGQDFVVAMEDGDKKAPTAWKPLRVTGRWLLDEWGMGRLIIEELIVLDQAAGWA